MNQEILTSVIIPVFNVRQYLEEALNSVISQTYKNLEVIIVDDGSTDGSSEICDEYALKDSRIQVIHQKNLGLSAARNAGLDIMSGQIVAFLDSDDAYCSNFIEAMVSSMIETKSDIVVCKYTNHNTEEAMELDLRLKRYPAIKQGLYEREKALIALVDGELDHIAWNKIYARHLWKEHRFPVGHVFEDLNTTYQIIPLCERIFVLDDILYLKRSHEGSIIKTFSKKNIDDWLLANAHFEKYVDDNTPDIFGNRQNDRLKRTRLHKLIAIYIFYSRTNKDKTIHYQKKLRREILVLEKKIGIGVCERHIKVYFFIIKYLPWVLGIIDWMYNPIRFCKNKFRK